MTVLDWRTSIYEKTSPKNRKTSQRVEQDICHIDNQ